MMRSAPGGHAHQHDWLRGLPPLRSLHKYNQTGTVPQLPSTTFDRHFRHTTDAAAHWGHCFLYYDSLMSLPELGWNSGIYNFDLSVSIYRLCDQPTAERACPDNPLVNIHSSTPRQICQPSHSARTTCGRDINTRRIESGPNSSRRWLLLLRQLVVEVLRVNKIPPKGHCRCSIF